MAASVGNNAPPADPVTLESVFGNIVSSTSTGEVKGKAITVLSTVIHTRAVKQALLRRPDVVRGICVMLMNPATMEHRFETLACIGELCRLETRGDSQNADVNNAICRQFVDLMVGRFDFLRSALQDIALDKYSDCAPLANDLILALPFEATDASRGSAPSSIPVEDCKGASTQEGEAAAASVPQTPSARWSKAQRDRSKDLMFLDERAEAWGFAPLVSRSSHLTCAACNKSSTDDVATEEAAGAKKTASFNRCAACKSVFYCSTACQAAHWKGSHKAACQLWKHALTVERLAFPGAATTALPLLFHPNRAFFFSQRPEMYKAVSFRDFFMNYNVDA